MIGILSKRTPTRQISHEADKRRRFNTILSCRLSSVALFFRRAFRHKTAYSLKARENLLPRTPYHGSYRICRTPYPKRLEFVHMKGLWTHQRLVFSAFELYYPSLTKLRKPLVCPVYQTSNPLFWIQRWLFTTIHLPNRVAIRLDLMADIRLLSTRMADDASCRQFLKHSSHPTNALTKISFQVAAWMRYM